MGPKGMSTYTMMDVMMASPERPLPEHKRTHQLLIMYEALHSLEQDPKPQTIHWDRVNNSILMMEALLGMGHIQDPDGLLLDAVEALGKAGFRSMEGQTLRLDGKDIMTVRGVLEDYSNIIHVMPERTMIQAHRKAEQRVIKIIKRYKR